MHRCNPTAISLKAGCELFLRYTTRTSALELEDFSAAKTRLIEVIACMHHGCSRPLTLMRILLTQLLLCCPSHQQSMLSSNASWIVLPRSKSGKAHFMLVHPHVEFYCITSCSPPEEWQILPAAQLTRHTTARQAPAAAVAGSMLPGVRNHCHLGRCHILLLYFCWACAVLTAAWQSVCRHLHQGARHDS